MSTVADWLKPIDELITSKRIEVITSDVFDTLVWRSVATPSDQFVHVGQRLLDEGVLAPHVDPVAFTEGRVLAEEAARRVARQETDTEEVGIEAIWQQMPEAWVTPAQRQRSLEIELVVEGEMLRLHDDVWRLLAKAHAAGIRIVLVSDIYLSASQLGELLGRAGAPLDCVDSIVTSADDGRGKASGLLAGVVRRLGCAPKRVLHIGDHPVSDIATAKTLGCRVLATDIPPDARSATGIVEALKTSSRLIGSDAGVSASIRTALVRAGRIGGDPAYQFGATVAGPVVGACAAWMSDQAAELGVESLHCLLREGATLADLARTTRPEGPTPLTINASRWVFLRASVIVGVPEELDRALARRSMFEARHVADAFNVPISDVRRVIGSDAVPVDRRPIICEQLMGDRVIRDAVMASSGELRGRLVRYLDNALAPTTIDGRERVVVADIGWAGTIQMGLEDIMRAEGRPIETIGLYLMLSPLGVQRSHMGRRMHGFLPVAGRDGAAAGIVGRNPELLEQICTPEIGTLIDIDQSGSPIIAEAMKHPTDSHALARRGLYDFVQAACETGALGRSSLLSDDSVTRSALLAGLAQTLQYPSPQLARRLCEWSHDDVAGESVEQLVDPSWERAIGYLDASSARAVTMNELFWLPGAAALENPTLAAQLDAVERGVDVDRLCPPSELGESLVAIFAHGTSHAELQRRRVPSIGPNGWTLQWVEGPLPSVRMVRVDFGDRPGFVELGFIEIILSTSNGTERIEISRVDANELVWHDAHVVAKRLVSVGYAGRVVVTVPESLGGRVESVTVRVAYRAWATEPPRIAFVPIGRRVRSGMWDLARGLRRRLAARGILVERGRRGVVVRRAGWRSKPD